MASHVITDRRPHRARENAFVGGVCAGLADYFELDAIVVRISAVLLAILTFGLSVIVYLVLWAYLPLEPESISLYDVMPESAESNAFGSVDCDSFSDAEKKVAIPLIARLAIAVGLMILFLVVATSVSPFLPGTHWWQFWPLAILMAGLCLIVIPVRTHYEAMWHSAGIVVTACAASILPMSLGIVSWDTIGSALSSFWTLIVVVASLFLMGLHHGNAAFFLAAAFCFVAFCLIGFMFCAIPGEIEYLLFYMPSGNSVRITIVG